jgi:uncharacterized protein YbjQ (UPF0145 family)
MTAGTVPLGGAANKETDLRQLGQALAAGENAPAAGPGGTTSDLSLDEILLLHSVGLEPAQVVFGVGCISIGAGVWTWSTGEVTDAQGAFRQAFEQAKESIRQQVHSAGALGVLGVDVEMQCSYHRYTIVITGTAVRSVTDEAGRHRFEAGNRRTAFLCDLSARDFVVLSSSGWYPLDLVAGVSYIHAPRRSLGTAIGQTGQNVELTNYTETLYQAREAAMGEMQQQIHRAGGKGLVDAKVIDRPVNFANHVIEFITFGTAIEMRTQQHTHPDVSMVVPLDDKVRTVEATALG